MYKTLAAIVLVVAGLVAATAYSATMAGMFRGGPSSGVIPPPITIVSISPSACSFTSGTQNGAVCTLVVNMSSGPAFSGTLGLCTGSNAPIAGCPSTNVANSGAFHLASCAGANCILQQSSSPSGTAAGTYSDVTAYAQQAGISNSPQFQQLTLTGSAAAPTIVSISPTTGSFTAGTSTAFMTVTAAMSSGSFTGTWSLATTGVDHLGTVCNNYSTNFTINAATGAITNNAAVSVGSYPGLCAVATQASASNSPYTQAITATGTSATPSFVSVSPTTGSFTAGSSTVFMTVTATLSSGSFTGTWSLTTTGTDHAGSTCTNYGTNFTINSASGAITNNASVAAGTYSGLCVTATQSGVSNSPYTQAVTATGVGTGAVVTSYTFQNGDPANPITPGSAGYPIVIGQSWRRGDLPTTGSPLYPICKDHSNGAILQCQFDDISTHRENGDDNSWRHATVKVLLPATSPQYSSGSIVACTGSPCTGTYTIDFVSQSGTYTPNVHGAINDICTGHDINIKLTDVRNQDDTLRGPSGFTGSLTFDVCSNLTNTGRDAPRQYAQGGVANGWIVRGTPVYGNGAADPMLYVQCYMLQTYTLAGAIGPLQHICSVHNSWMNTAAGTVGNAGAPGPVGFANDPQAISYRPVLYDGSTPIIDWGTTWFDETISNTALNVSTGIWTIPALGSGTNDFFSLKAWGNGNAFRYTSSGTPPSATQHATNVFQNGTLLYTCGSSSGCGPEGSYNPQRMMFTKYSAYGYENMPTYTSQGSGNSTFSWRIQHYHWTAWVTLDPVGYPNWAPPGSTTRYTSMVEPQFTLTQKTYWQQTGTVPPIGDQPAGNFQSAPQNSGDVQNVRYAPEDKITFQLSTGVGGRADIGLQNEYVSEAFVVQSHALWRLARTSSYVELSQSQSDLLNEVTGRLPTLNHGPPAVNHGGNGTPYSGLGALGFENVQIFNATQSISGVAAPLENVPYNDCAGNACSLWAGGPTFKIQDNTHQSAYAYGLYQLMGDAFWIYTLQQAANRTLYYTGGQCDNVNTSGNQFGVTATSANYLGSACTLGGVTYYTVIGPGDERRGQAWAMRDIAAAGTFGGDVFSNVERQYFNDVLTEGYWFQIACGLPCGMIDPPTPNAGPVVGGGGTVNNPSLTPPNSIIYNSLEGGVNSTFFDEYMTQTVYMIWGQLHHPWALHYLSMQYRLYAGTCGDDGTTPPVGNSPSSYFCATYYYSGPSHTITSVNTTDGSDWQADDFGGGNWTQFTAGSKTMGPVLLISYNSRLANSFDPAIWTWTSKIKFYNLPQSPHNGQTCSHLPDQITDGTWYYAVNTNPTTGTFQIATTPGSGNNGTIWNMSSSALGPFTVSGVGYSGTPCDAMFRADDTVAALNPTSGNFVAAAGYFSYAFSGITALIDINQSVGNLWPTASVMRNNMITRLNNNTAGWTYLNATAGDTIANGWWDPTIVVK